ncbi:KPN_02809 family neutral zinc metallopeptidase [Dyella sp.]|uniref:KPN_02809 family neutral zinc metallopeptidase n=1 Tax=Dyella sp. TaxID=1869338 RepID=UPI002ED27888
MDWQKGERSQNVEVDDGSGGGGGGGFRFGGGRGLGLGGIIILAILGMVFFKDPTALLGQAGSGGTPSAAAPPRGRAAQVDPREEDFVRAVLGSSEKTWSDIFAAHGQTYTDPKLVLFSGAVNTACGSASSAVGPFYCPGDQRVYLDLAFFRELETRFHTVGDFARAYVIAHEVGHHVQNLMGVFARSEQARRRGVRMEGAGGLSVRQELQADCFAGVWANRTQDRLHWLQPGDVESALNAASQIGDDALQRQAQGRVVPDSFTHGTSQQRVKWFTAGFKGGDVSACDTFNGPV